VGKDVGAGAVLISALAAVLVGLLILGPPLWARLVSLFNGN
jgi:diacylglycerol kinase